MLAVVKRELITVLRLRRTMGWVCLLLFFCMWIVLEWWPGGEMIPWQMASHMRILFLSLSGVNLAACVILVPSMAAATIVSEKEQDTFDLVRMSLIRPSGLILGKLISGIGVYGLILIATFPFLMCTMFGIGMEIQELILIFALTGITAVSCAMTGILFSAWVRRSVWAIVLSYLAVALIMINPIVIGYGGILLFCELFQVGSSIRYANAEWIYGLSPFITLIVLTAEQRIPLGSLAYGAAFHGLWWIICFIISVRLLKRSAEPPKIEQYKPIDDARLLRKRRTTFPFYLIDPLKRKKPIEDRHNPMLLRELRWGLFARSALLIRVFLLVVGIFLIFSLFSYFGGTPRMGEYIAIWFTWLMVILLFMAPAMMANIFTKEYELKNLDMMRMTLMSPSQIVVGKGLACIAGVFPIILAGLVGSIPFILKSTQYWGVVFWGHVYMILCATVCATLCLNISMESRRTVVSVVASYLAVLAVFVGVLFAALYVVNQYGYDYRYDDYSVRQRRTDMAVFVSPIAAYINRYTARGRLDSSYLFANVAVFGGLAALLGWRCLRVFKRFQIKDR